MCALQVYILRYVNHGLDKKDLSDQVELLAIDGRVTLLQSYRNKIKPEVTSPEIGDVEAYVRGGSTLNLNRGGCSGGRGIECRP
jgi:hypothetical protein